MAKRNGITALRVVTLTVLLVVVGGVYFVFSNLFHTDTRIPAERLAPVSRGEIVRSVVATGRIEPVTKVEVKSKASGIIQYLYVDEGDAVRRGQILAELDREQLEASLREAQAGVMARRAMLDRAEAEWKSARVALDTAQSAVKDPTPVFTARELDRVHRLHAEQLISRADLDTAEQAHEAALLQAELRQQTVRLRESELYTAEKAIHQARADLYGAEAATQRAEENLRNATIRSAIDGVVLKRQLEVGDAVSSILQLGSNATLIMTVGDTSELFFRGAVDESDIGQIQVGQAANLTVDTFRDQLFAGEVSRIAPMGQETDNVTRFEVRVRLRSDGSRLLANMSANAEVILERRPDALTIPETALRFTADRDPVVDVVNGANDRRSVRQTPVQIGIRNGARVEIVAGLSEHDRVLLQ